LVAVRSAPVSRYFHTAPVEINETCPSAGSGEVNKPITPSGIQRRATQNFFMQEETVSCV
jgi:hypothetical protein